MRHVVMFSGGLGSWMSAKRVAERHGTDNLTLLFADVKGDSTDPHVGEDEDTYRFINEAAANVGGELVRVADGRDIWQVFRDDKFLGNSRLANCSKYLKQKPCRDWLDANCDPANTVIYVGLDWSEPHRIPGNRLAYAHPFNRPCVDVRSCLAFVNGAPNSEPCKRHMETPWRVEFPMNERPYLNKVQMAALCEAEGIEVPRLYKAGYAHNNCGGGCVRAGQAQFELLLRENRDRYLAWERGELSLQEHLGKPVTILRRTADGHVTPLSLREFRERLDEQPNLFDEYDVGACGCFSEDLPTESAVTL